jgi:two-component sensor histidine kinase
MALIHEKMYKGDLIKDIDIKEYIEDLSASLIANYSDNKDIKLQITTDVDSIQLNHIVPFSLIINELISNSLKHAFANRQSGIISLSISKQIKNSNNLKYNELVLHYKDDGIWKAPQNESSFGLELIDTFTDQLDGEYVFNGNNGADYLFTFKEINVNN